MIRSVRGNSVPAAGATATTPQNGQQLSILPDTASLIRMSEVFGDQSEYNCAELNTAALTPGQQISFQLNNTGLGESLDLQIEGSISLVNTSTAAQAVSVSPEFPFNLISNLLVQFNGQTVIHSLSGYELLALMAKRRRNVFVNPGASAGAVYAQTACRVSRTLASMVAGANVTFTTGNTLTGVTSMSIAGSATGVFTFKMNLELPFTFRKDILLGLLPLQNNSVYANVQLTAPTMLGTTAASPLFVAGAVPATLSNSANAITVKPTYNFFAIPAPNDPRMYGFFVGHSYMLLSQPNNTVSSTGSEALQYSIPNNFYLVAMLATLRDGAGALVNVPTVIDYPYLNYNNTTRVDRKPILTKMAKQELYYEAIPCGPGQLLWDGASLGVNPNSAWTSAWLDMYLANNPQLRMDIASGTTTPVSYAVCREQIVPAQVQVI